MVVDFNKYVQKRENKLMFEEIINHLKNQGQNGNLFDSSDQIELLAKTILQEVPYYHYKSPTPVIKIAGEFGINTYKTDKLDKELSGIIYVGGTTEKVYGKDKVILVDEDEPLKHQRFIIAHEIAHYLLDCLTNPQYNDSRILFSEGYPKSNHDSPKERKADLFAAELLMPTDLFKDQYDVALKENKHPMFILMYLSDYFQTKMSSIEKRFVEVFGNVLA